MLFFIIAHVIIDIPVGTGIVRLVGGCRISLLVQGRGRGFKNTYELLNLIPLLVSTVHKVHIFQCMGKIFYVEFQMVRDMIYLSSNRSQTWQTLN